MNTPDLHSSPSAQNLTALVRENAALLRELLEHLKGLSDEEYGLPCSLLGGEKYIGPHCRHICDHYDAFFRAMDHTKTRGRPIVDYDKRERCSKTEQKREVAIRRIENCLLQLSAIETQGTDTQLRLSSRLFVGSDGHVTLNSNVARELCFLASHTTHHSAFVGLLSNALSLNSGAVLGRAAATRAYDQKLLQG